MEKDSRFMLRLPTADLAAVEVRAGRRGRSEWVREAIRQRLNAELLAAEFEQVPKPKSAVPERPAPKPAATDRSGVEARKQAWLDRQKS